jgi:hypothetical protein
VERYDTLCEGDRRNSGDVGVPEKIGDASEVHRRSPYITPSLRRGVSTRGSPVFGGVGEGGMGGRKSKWRKSDGGRLGGGGGIA